MLINQQQAQKFLPKSLSWFERARWSGLGPKYKKIGRNVFYDQDELLSWIDSHTSVSSTTEAAMKSKKNEGRTE